MTFVNASSTNQETVGHGLGAAPKLIISKNRDTGANNWAVFHASVCDTTSKFLKINTTDALSTYSTVWGAALPTSTVFGVTGGGIATASVNVVAYCFSEIAGYSKFGSYTGNGSATGPTVTTGFKPAMVLYKNASFAGTSWAIVDSTRDVTNPLNSRLFADSSSAEDTSVNTIELTDTGFNVVSTNDGVNRNGDTIIYMAFKDTREYAFWLDDSGNNNDWQPNGGITTESTVTDTPTPYADGGNYAVLNPLAADGGTTLTNANLTISSANYGNNTATFFLTSGKWYWEASGTGYVGAVCGSAGINFNNSISASGSNSIGYWESGTVYWDGGNAGVGTLASYTSSDIIGIELNMDTGAVAFYKNNVFQYRATFGSGTIPNLVSGVFPCYNNGLVSTTKTVSFNFGQRPFAYTPPTGFLPLHTGNLPDVAIENGSEYFAATLYSGQATDKSVTGVGFQPDLTWIKRRDGVDSHVLADSVRGSFGAGFYSLFSNLTNAESTSLQIETLDADGFTVNGDTSATNRAGQTYVAWNWKAGGAAVTNTSGSITSQVSASPTAGFSVVTYTGTGANATVGHSLGVAPKMVITKGRDAVPNNWGTWHTSLGALGYLYLNTTSAAGSLSTFWNSAVPTSSVFSLGSETTVNTNTKLYVAYCFSEVPGYSKFGSYVGNGSSDGPFVYLGFRPKFVMFKRTDSTQQWVLYDTARDVYNAVSNYLVPSASSAEAGFVNADFLSNGFKLRSTSSLNISGGDYIYMAFAENPFKNSLAR